MEGLRKSMCGLRGGLVRGCIEGGGGWVLDSGFRNGMGSV